MSIHDGLEEFSLGDHNSFINYRMASGGAQTMEQIRGIIGPSRDTKTKKRDDFVVNDHQSFLKYRIGLGACKTAEEIRGKIDSDLLQELTLYGMRAEKIKIERQITSDTGKDVAQNIVNYWIRILMDYLVDHPGTMKSSGDFKVPEDEVRLMTKKMNRCYEIMKDRLPKGTSLKDIFIEKLGLEELEAKTIYLKLREYGLAEAA